MSLFPHLSSSYTIEYHEVPQDATQRSMLYYRVLHSKTEYSRQLCCITGYHTVLHSTTEESEQKPMAPMSPSCAQHVLNVCALVPACPPCPLGKIWENHKRSVGRLQKNIGNP